MSLREDPHLGLVAGEADEPETLGLARLDVLLYLEGKAKSLQSGNCFFFTLVHFQID